MSKGKNFLKAAAAFVIAITPLHILWHVAIIGGVAFGGAAWVKGNLGGGSDAALLQAGVPKELAEMRKETYKDVVYTLHFNIPEQKDSSVMATETVALKLDKKHEIILDFREPASSVHSVSVNGRDIKAHIKNEHVVIPAKYTRAGDNEVSISLRAGDQSLNRRDEFVYTLLVPDRARTLFPCFDQPDLKAEYNLTLTIPDSWVAVSNTVAVSETDDGHGKTVKFGPTEPLSTYLFSFVAGKFQIVTGEQDGRTVHLYHRETDPAKVAQCPEVLRMVFAALKYQEEYTGVPYPFAKYDLIVLPDFQYGGMEHTGATLYNDGRIFLGEKPTTTELLDRAQLIDHETTHMWFGDYVTMRWFDDVWTKEVFANWFAGQMARPEFPSVNHQLSDMNVYYAPSYSEDRTVGSNAIQRPLDNLSNAGLIYCNIIYDKAPVVLDKLAHRMGMEKFRQGIQEYVRTYGYANADWDELIAILDKYADFSVAEWSRIWIKEKGMPIYSAESSGSKVTISQTDPFDAGNIWPQEIKYLFVCKDGCEDHSVTFDSASQVTVEADSDVLQIIPNVDGYAYGCFLLDETQAGYLYDYYAGADETCRMSLLMTLYENVWRGRIDAGKFVSWASKAMLSEKNPLILSSMLSDAVAAAKMSGEGCGESLERSLLAMAKDPSRDHEARLLSFRKLYQSAAPCGTTDGSVCEQLYDIWLRQRSFPGLTLSEYDYTEMAYQLMIRFPERAGQIRQEQLGRITNPDRHEAFEWISQAAAQDKAERYAFFQELLKAENRRNEPRALKALGLLNHPLRQQDAISYIQPALNALEDVQRTGDIFFPASWCRTLLSGHNSEAAYKEVRAYLDAHPDLNPLLKTKVLQSAGWLVSTYGD